jgi:uncharacterized membrane protein YbhN (UPF0104 family)
VEEIKALLHRRDLELNSFPYQGQMNKKRLRAGIVTLISLLAVLAFAYYLYANADRYVGLLDLSATGVAALLVLAMAVPLLSGTQNTLLYRALGAKDFSQRDGILISAASTLANQLPLPGGIVSKGVYLKRMHGLSYATFLSSTLALFFCFLSLQGLVGLASLIYIASLKDTAPFPVLWTGFALMTACPLLLWLPVDRLRLRPTLQAHLRSALDGWLIVGHKPVMLLQILGIQLIIVLLLALRYWLAFGMLSQDVSVAQVLVMSSASILTQLVSLAPGGLGVREAIVGAVSWALGFDAVVSLAAAGLDRLVSTLAIILMGGVGTMILGREMAESRVQPGNSEPK